MKYQVRTKPKNGENENCRTYFLDEFEIFDGESFVKFNLIDISKTKMEITVAVTHEGKIAVVTYPLVTRKGQLAFEYGPEETPICVSDFKKVED